MEPSLSADLLVAGHRVARMIEARLTGLDLSAGEAMVLATLGERPLTMGGIQDALHIGPSTATSLITRLERAGRVTRERNPDDARSIVVQLTPGGRETSQAAARIFEQLDAELEGDDDVDVAGHRAFMRRLASESAREVR
jgi:DNA-binding MarR family transcriptional regulator